MSAGHSPLFPGDEAQGEAVRAHREAMETLNPAPAPVAGTPAKDDSDKGSAKNSSRLPKNWKRIPDKELQSMTKKLGSAPVYDKGGKVNVADGKHEVAILKDGERVLTEAENKKYEKTEAGAGAKETPMKVTAKTAAGKSPKQEGEDMDCYDEGGVVHSPEEKAHFHRAMSHLNTGGLHRHLGMAEDKPIPMAKKEAAANSDDPHVAAMGRMAVAMAHWHHKHGSKK